METLQAETYAEYTARLNAIYSNTTDDGVYLEPEENDVAQDEPDDKEYLPDYM